MISDLLTVIDEVRGSGRRSDWAERDRAIVLTAVLTGPARTSLCAPTSGTSDRQTTAVSFTCMARATRTAGYR